MKFSIKNITYGLAACLAATALTGCADDDFRLPDSDATRTDAQLVISIPIPRGNEPRTDADTRADGDGTSAQSKPDMDVTKAEGKINSLRLLIFDDANAKVLNRPLTIPSELPDVVSNTNLANYEIKDLKPGKYCIYVIANYDVEDIWNVNSISDLEKVMLDYGNSNKLPKAGNLPMVYESGNLFEIKEGGDPVLVDAALKINAVKVTYNIIFDKVNNDETKNTFGNFGLRVKSATINGIPVTGSLLESKTVNDPNIWDGYIDNNGGYSTSWIETTANADKDDVTVIHDVSGNVSSVSGLNQWLFQSTVYLPEHYVVEGDESKETTLKLDCELTKDGTDAGIPSDYTIHLARHDKGETEKSMPRNTFYEVIGKIETTKSTVIDAVVYAKKWSDQLIDVDFIATELWLDKLEASVTSDTDDVFIYRTDARGGAEFECQTKLDGVNAIIAEYDRTNNLIKVRVNPAVNVDNLQSDQSIGTAICYVTAGNLRKQVKVKYDISPFFRITTAYDLKSFYNSTGQIYNPETAIFKWETNLGGIQLTEMGNFGTKIFNSNSAGSTTINKGESKITLTFTDPTAPTGTITVTPSNVITSTIVHRFDAYSRKASDKSEYQGSDYMAHLSFSVQPTPDEYSVYFRAINDYYEMGGENADKWIWGNDPVTHANYPVEDYTASEISRNWCDWWDTDHTWQTTSENVQCNNDTHRIYYWTQEGETTKDHPDDKAVWYYFNSEDNDTNHRYMLAPKMTGDNNNPGWYYYKIEYNQESVSTNDYGAAKGTTRNVAPGTTLMIFHNKVDGVNRHRVTQHQEAGIPLFNFEDREGWILYDPTTSPNYRIFDSKPVVEDVIYNIWLPGTPEEWYLNYGVANNDDWSQKWTIKSNTFHTTSDTKNVDGVVYTKYQLRFKCARGYYAKAIRLKMKDLKSAPMVINLDASKQRAYYLNNGGDNVFAEPYIYVWNGSQNNGPFPGTKMTRLGNTDDGVYYYFDINSTYRNGSCIISRGSSGSGNQSGTFSLGTTSHVMKSNDWSWSEFTKTQLSVTASNVSLESQLFAGRNWTEGHLTINSNGQWVWVKGAPK